MSRIKIRNFGPIKHGLEGNNGWIEFKKITVFTGNQGSGKSTVAKLVSTLSWIEKAIVRGKLPSHFFDTKGGFEEICVYHNIDNYFYHNTEIEYESDAMHFHFSEGQSSIVQIPNIHYLVPKIMYIPAERNFIGAVMNLYDIEGLPGSVYTFSDEYRKAIKEIKLPVRLPIDDVYFEYYHSLDDAAIASEDFLIQLASSSSGFQSAVPLFLVTRYLAEGIHFQRNLPAHSQTNRLTLEQEERIRQELQDIRNNRYLSENIKRMQIELLSSRYENSYFLNIVEEPEQNLYPTSQRQMLFSLLTYNNMVKRNQLVMTTHSPFLINYLTLAVKGGLLFETSGLKDETIAVISNIVPPQSSIVPDDLVIYEMDAQNGTIKKLKTVNGLPSDENNLNEELDKFNELYTQLVELQFNKK